MIQCYLCGAVEKERYMVPFTEGGREFYWCVNPEWCRARATVNKLKADGFLASSADSTPPSTEPL